MTDSQLDFSALTDVIPGPTPEVRERLTARLQTLIESEQQGHVEPRGRWQRVPWTHRALVVAVAAAILVVFFVPLPHVSLFKNLVSPGSRLTTPTSVVPATVTPTSQGLPRDVTGVEQSFRAVPVPSWFVNTEEKAAIQRQPGQMGCLTMVGQPLAFSVGNSPTFIVWNGSLTAFKPVCPSHPHIATYLEYEGNGLAGTGYDGVSGSPGTVEGTATTLLLIPDWPAAGRQVYVWADLPSDVAYVTYSYEGRDLTWVRPQRGVAAFLVPRPAVFDGSYAVWYTAPFPLVTAYNADGVQLAREKAPRVDGDDFGRSPSGVVTGVASVCHGPRVPAGEVLHGKVSLYSGSILLASESVRSGAKYRFSVIPGSYRLTGWWGSRTVTIRAGHIVVANFMIPKTCI